MKLIISSEIEQKIHDYVMSVDSEIAGMGKVRVEDGNVIVEDVMIYEQDVTGVTADLSPQAMAKWQTDLVRAGGSPKDWRLWWHSHDTMGAFFSKRDTDTMDEQTEGEWMISLVVNKKRERKARLDTYRPFRISLSELDIEIDGTTGYNVPQSIIDEVASKVKTVTPSTKYANGYSMGYGYDSYSDESYNKVHLISLAKILEGQIERLTEQGKRSSDECADLISELVDKYYELAGEEKSPILSDLHRKKAEVLESELYGINI